MKVIRFAVAALLVGILVWKVAFPSYEWRQKITIEIETPAGPVSASSVAEINWWGTPGILPHASPRDHSVDAEAVVLRLPDGRYIFSLTSTAAFIARSVLFDPPYRGDSYLGPASRTRSFLGEPHEVPRANYPRLVTFGDIADPVTIKAVDPDDLDASFGCPGESELKPWREAGMMWAEWQRWQATGVSREEWDREKQQFSFANKWRKTVEALPQRRDNRADCFRLTSIVLEITEEPTSQGQAKAALPWLSSFGDTMLDGNKYRYVHAPNRLANDLALRDFMRKR